MFTVIIVVCSLKSMCIPSFVLIGCCMSELHGHLCLYRNVWPEAVIVVLQELQHFHTVFEIRWLKLKKKNNNNNKMKNSEYELFQF